MKRTKLEQFVASTPARESLFRLWLDNEALLRVVLSLFGNSVFLSNRLIQQPDLLDTLLDPASLARPKTMAELHHGLESILTRASRYEERLDAVRRFKRAEEFRIGLREIAGEADILATIIAFLEAVDMEVAEQIRTIHLVCDHVSTHHGKEVRTWLAHHPRFFVHFTPVHCSWMNQVGQWFSILQRKRLRIADFESKDQLHAKLQQFIQEWNQHAHPFNWSPKSVANIMAAAPALAA